MTKKSTRTIAVIFNIIIILLAVVSIGSQFVFPKFWSAKASYTFEETKIEKKIEEALNDLAEEEPLFASVDMAKIAADAVDEKGISVNLALDLEMKDLISSLTKPNTEFTQKIVDENVDAIVAECSTLINNVAQTIIDETGLPEESKPAFDETVADFTAQFHDEIVEIVPNGTAKMLATMVQYIAYLTSVSMFAWLYLVLKILIKAPTCNNAIRVKAPIFFGWLPFLVLYLIPTFAFEFIQKILPSLLGFNESVLAGLSATFTTNAWIAPFAAIALIVLWILGYRKIYKTLKSIKNGNIEKV